MAALAFTPPILFIVLFAIFQASSRSLGKYSFNGHKGIRTTDSYACGETDIENYVNPDYSQFFPYAFFFTIMHVLVLIVATAPYDAPLLPIIFIASGILSMVILLER